MGCNVASAWRGSSWSMTNVSCPGADPDPNSTGLDGIHLAQLPCRGPTAYADRRHDP